MHAEIDAATDVALIGAWDQSRQNSPLPRKQAFNDKILDADARDGHLFYIQTRSDGGWPVHIYIDESPPQYFKPAPRSFRLRVPTGKLIIGGLEDYRSEKPQITAENSIVTIPPGDYALTCCFLSSPESDYTDAEFQEAAMSADDIAFYRQHLKRLRHFDFLGCLIFLLPIALLVLGWLWDVILSVTIGIACILLITARKSRLKRNVRWIEIQTRLDATRPWQDATFIFHLTTLAPGDDLIGGNLPMEDLWPEDRK